jgi:small subunit ribosomal protein S8e
MVQYHGTRHSKTSGSGGRLHRSADKSRAKFGGFFARTKVIRPEDLKPGQEAKERRYAFRIKGGRRKISVDIALCANVVGPDGATKKMRVLNVLDNPGNRHYSRENVVTKSSIILVEGGKARVTSRPGQDGVVNAVMLKQ